MIIIRENILESMAKYKLLWQKVRKHTSFFLILTFLIFLVFGSVFYWLCFKINSWQAEKAYWEGLLFSGINPGESIGIPTADKLPEIIELCQDCLIKNRVEIASFNVEKFTGITEPADSGGLDYANLRIYFLGKWQEIETGLNELEHMDKLAIHVQEVILKPEGGEALLQIYFLNN
ncbi:MAG: hypothetical protein PHZ11_08140 [Desulfitobacteriaceae bacterium]|nr:hypothetical protein [Desulfitobacteriaceae bacterium]MDD4346837.1 hypothetical protein [Desulfitobacteriaceae bacterium]MDD4401056.1 hypothetical protein [Desulfitobacteriaceae bacterium]